jgi:hypothetical protein
MEMQLNLDLKHQLKLTVENWVDRTFNFHQLEVVEKWCDGNLYEYIRKPSKETVFTEWLWEMDSNSLIKDYCDDNRLDFSKYEEVEQGGIDEIFINSYSKIHWYTFMSVCFDTYEDDIDDFINEKENYPLWNTLFEFRQDYFNSEEDSEKCLNVGLGLIEGLEPFNNMVFMTSGGHSFYSSYWIPLYLEIYPDEKEKYKEVDFSDL